MRKTIQRLLSLALCLLLCAGLLPGAVWAAEIVDSGTCGENLTWTLDSDGKLTISGTGKMKDYDYDSGSRPPWYGKSSSVKTVEIHSGVTSIGNDAFAWCSSLTSVTIPDSVTSIGDGAFVWCSSLTSVTIPNSVTSIGDYVFDYCDSLTSVTIPNSVTSIGYKAFRYCDSLTSVTIPDSVTSIGREAFYRCSSLTSVYIDDLAAWCSISFGNYDSNPLYYAKNLYLKGELLTDCIIPDSVTSIGDDAFHGCSSLTSVTIGKSVTSIGDSAFEDCRSLTSVTIPDSVTSIGDGAFYRCSSLTSVTISDSVTSIGDDAFYYCSSLTSVTIGNSVTSIGDWAFRYCSSLTSVTIPDSVTSIGSDAFEYCTSLTSVTIGNSVTSIGSSAFRDCSSLTSVTIGNSVTSIGSSAFRDCSSLTSVTIPNSVTSIGNDAFYKCSSLTSVTIPDSVTSIGYDAFYKCSSLTSVTIPDSVTSIGDEAFFGCSSLTDVYYSGTEAQWNAIKGGGKPSGNGITIHFETSGPGDPKLDPDYNNDQIYFYKNELKLQEGQELTVSLYMNLLKYIVEDMPFPDFSTITWTSSNEQVVSIVSASTEQPDVVIRGNAGGSAVLTATMPDGRTASCTVQVEAKKNQVTLAGKSTLFLENPTDVIHATINFNLILAGETITFTSSDPNVAAFDNAGTATIRYEMSTIPWNDFTQTYDIPLVARGKGTAKISCDLKSGGGYSYTVAVTTKKEADALQKQQRELRQLANEWITAYNTYVNSIEQVLRKESEVVDANQLLSDSASMKERLNEYGIEFSFYDGRDEQKEQILCRALLQMMADRTATELVVSDIKTDKLQTIPIKIVNKVVDGIEHTNYTYREDDVTVEISLSTYSGANLGYANYRKGNGPPITIVIHATPNSVKDILQRYAADLLKFDELLVKEAYKQVYKELSKSIFGKDVSSLTESLFKEKLAGPIVERLREAGLGNAVDMLNQCYQYYKYIDKLLSGDISILPKMLEKADQIEFKDKDATKNVTKEALKALEKVRKKINKAIGHEEWNSWTEYVMSLQKTTINCPVDILIYDGTGANVGYVGTEESWYNEDSVYIEQLGDTKTIYTIDDTYSFKMLGTDYGTLNCTFETYRNGESAARTNYYDIPLYEGKEVLAAAHSTGLSEGGETIAPDETLTKEQYEAATVNIYTGLDLQDAGAVYGSGSYVRGDSVKLQAIPKLGYVFLGWFTANGELASISTVYEFVAKEDQILIAHFAAETIEEAEIEGIDLAEDGLTVLLSTEEPEPVLYIAAYAEDGRMLWSSFKETASGKTKTAFDVPDADSYKVFAVNKEFEPLCNAYTVVKQLF